MIKTVITCVSLVSILTKAQELTDYSNISNGGLLLKNNSYAMEGLIQYLAVPYIYSKDYSISQGYAASQITTSIFDVSTEGNSDYAVKSNPISTEIEIISTKTNAKYCLTDLLGNKISSTTSKVIQVSHLPLGMYMLYITEENKIVKTFKLIKN